MTFPKLTQVGVHLRQVICYIALSSSRQNTIFSWFYMTSIPHVEYALLLDPILLTLTGSQVGLCFLTYRFTPKNLRRGYDLVLSLEARIKPLGSLKHRLNQSK